MCQLRSVEEENNAAVATWQAGSEPKPAPVAVTTHARGREAQGFPEVPAPVYSHSDTKSGNP